MILDIEPKNLLKRQQPLNYSKTTFRCFCPQATILKAIHNTAFDKSVILEVGNYKKRYNFESKKWKAKPYTVDKKQMDNDIKLNIANALQR